MSVDRSLKTCTETEPRRKIEGVAKLRRLALNFLDWNYVRTHQFFGRPFVKQFALYAVGPLSVCPVCLLCSVCDVGVLWPNGWMDQE